MHFLFFVVAMAMMEVPPPKMMMASASTLSDAVFNFTCVDTVHTEHITIAVPAPPILLRTCQTLTIHNCSFLKGLLLELPQTLHVASPAPNTLAIQIAITDSYFSSNDNTPALQVIGGPATAYYAVDLRIVNSTLVAATEANTTTATAVLVSRLNLGGVPSSYVAFVGCSISAVATGSKAGADAVLWSSSPIGAGSAALFANTTIAATTPSSDANAGGTADLARAFTLSNSHISGKRASLSFVGCALTVTSSSKSVSQWVIQFKGSHTKDGAFVGLIDTTVASEATGATVGAFYFYASHISGPATLFLIANSSVSATSHGYVVAWGMQWSKTDISDGASVQIVRSGFNVSGNLATGFAFYDASKLLGGAAIDFVCSRIAVVARYNGATGLDRITNSLVSGVGTRVRILNTTFLVEVSNDDGNRAAAVVFQHQSGSHLADGASLEVLGSASLVFARAADGHAQIFRFAVSAGPQAEGSATRPAIVVADGGNVTAQSRGAGNACLLFVDYDRPLKTKPLIGLYNATLLVTSIGATAALITLSGAVTVDNGASFVVSRCNVYVEEPSLFPQPTEAPPRILNVVSEGVNAPSFTAGATLYWYFSRHSPAAGLPLAEDAVASNYSCDGMCVNMTKVIDGPSPPPRPTNPPPEPRNCDDSVVGTMDAQGDTSSYHPPPRACDDPTL